MMKSWTALRSTALLCGLVVLLLAVNPPPIHAAARDREAAREAYRKAVDFHRALLERASGRQTPADYQQAISLYTRVLDHDPTYGACDDALFSIASLFEEMARTFQVENARREALKNYQFLVDQYPLTKHRPEANERLAALRAQETMTAKEQLKGDAQATVNEIRYWSNEDYTRVVIQLDREVEFVKDILTNPDRLYFDLLSTRLASGLGTSYDVNGVFLNRVRLAENRPGIVRVVLDFEKISRHSVFALYDPFRIIIDTRGQTSPSASRPRAEGETVKTAEAVISLDKGPSKRELTTEKPAVPSPNANGDLSLTRVLGLKVGRVAIDAGHGGHDSGTVGPSGLKEKDLVLDISLKLKHLLESRLDTEVTLTRNSDEFIALEDRTAIANKNGADLFVSIHANASRNRKASGIETFFQGLASAADEREVASRENASSQRNIRELENLLKRIALDDYNDESSELAHVIQSSLYEEVKPVRPASKNRGVKSAPFIVLINSTMPSVLAEIGFISNPDDEKHLKTEAARDLVAEGLFKGIEAYFRALGGLPPAGEPATPQAH